MSKLHIVTDGAADMPSAWVNEFNINILRMPVQLGGKTYFLPDPQMPAEKFYKLIRELREIPHSSLPSISHVVDFYRSIAERGDEILSIHVASKMSGTFSVIQNVANELKEEYQIYPFDSGAGSAVLGFMCRHARRLANWGLSTESIMQRLEVARTKISILLTLDNLEFARLSGRVNSLQSTISSLLRINPIIELREGLLQIAGRVRTRHKAVESLIGAIKEKVADQKMNFAVVHAADYSTAYEIQKMLGSLFTNTQIIISELALPVAANLGPGTVGIVLYPDDEIFAVK